ncbi:histidine phosphatase family protein, partial [Escherichia coli]
MKLILVRHAETESNLDGIILGHSDSSLTCRGLRVSSVLLAAFSASEYQ